MKLLIYSEDVHLNLRWTPAILDEVFRAFKHFFMKKQDSISPSFPSRHTLWGDNIGNNIVFVLHYLEALSAGLLERFEGAGSECDKSENEQSRGPSVRVEEAVSVARDAITISPRKM
jgi:hypothetical protein